MCTNRPFYKASKKVVVMVEGKIVEDPAKVEIADAVMNVKEAFLVDNNKFVSLNRIP